MTSTAAGKIRTNLPRISGVADAQKSPIVVDHDFLARKYEQNVAKSSSSGSRTPEFDFRGGQMSEQTGKTEKAKGPAPVGLSTRLARDAKVFVTEPPASSRLPKGIRRPPIHWFDAPEGVFREVWTPVILPRLKAIVDGNARRVPAPRKFTVSFKFRGPSPERARPTLLVTCQTKNTAQYLKEIITKDSELQELFKKHECSVKYGIDGTQPLAKGDKPIYGLGGESLSQTKLPLDLDEDEDSDAEPLHEPEIESLATLSTAMVSPEIISPSTSFLGRPAGSEVLSGSDMAPSDKNKSPTLLPADFPLPASPPLRYGEKSGYSTPPVATSENFEIYALADLRSYRNDLRGMEVAVSSSRFDGKRKATIGGIITVDGKPYGLTANHAWDIKGKSRHSMEPRDFEWLDEDKDEFNETERTKDTDTDDDLAFDSEGTYSDSSSEDEKETPPPKIVYPDSSLGGRNKRPAKPGPGPFAAFESDADVDHKDEKRPPIPVSKSRGLLGSVVGAAAAFARGSNAFVERKRAASIPFTPNIDGQTETEKANTFFTSATRTKSKHDWYLIPFEGALGGAKLNVSQTTVGNVAMPSQATNVTCCAAGAGVIDGFLSCQMVSQYESGEWTELLTVRFGSGGPKPGDSGSWILDTSNNDMYGHIISRSESLPVSYVSPAVRVFEEIASKMNTNIETIQFPRIIQPKGIDLEAAERKKLEEIERLRGAENVNTQLRERREREMRAERRRLRREKEDDKCIVQ